MKKKVFKNLRFSRCNKNTFIVNFQKPERVEWGSGLEAMQAALALEKSVNQSLLDLHAIADKHKDYQVIVLPFIFRYFVLCAYQLFLPLVMMRRLFVEDTGDS